MAKVPSLMDLRALSPLEWVKEERRRQDEKYGVENRSPSKMFRVLAEEVGESAKVINDAEEGAYTQEGYERHLEYELIQVAAVAIKWVEMLRRAQGSEKMPRLNYDFHEKKKDAGL